MGSDSPYNRARAALEDFLGIYVYRKRYLPFGVHLGEDLRRHLPHLAMRTVFDVGANVGQSAVEYLKWFPGARIYCFEPVADTFHQLSKNMADHAGVSCHHAAVGESNGTTTVMVRTPSVLAFVPSKGEAIPPGTSAETTEMVTLDRFCERERVKHVEFLKIDTEGHDLEVLKGCARLLAEQRIDVVQVEAGMAPSKYRHVSFESLKAHLNACDYTMFGIYGQEQDEPVRSPFLRRVDAVFVSRRLIAEAPASAR